MATYKYTAISKDGVKVSGVVEGFNEFDAVDRIKQDCDIVLKLTEVEEKKPGLLSMEIGGNRLNAKAFSLMCAQFSIILQSGIPIGRTVRLIGDKMTDKKLKGILKKVAEDVEAGRSVATSFQERGASCFRRFSSRPSAPERNPVTCPRPLRPCTSIMTNR